MWILGFADEPAPPEIEDPTAAGEDEDDVGDLVVALLPWLISILLHAGVVLLAVFVVWSTIKQVDEEEVIVPIARLSETPGAPLTMKTTKRKTQSQTSSTSSAARRSLSSASNSKSSSLTSAVSASESSLIGAAGGGGGGAGKASPFGSMAGGGAEFKATFFGTGGNAKRLVYLVDASGSLIDTLPFVIQELKRSVGELKDKQSFSVIFFQGDDYLEAPPPGLRKATGDYKRKIIKWVDADAGNVIPMGMSSPVDALGRALRYKPQLMFLLSDNITGRGRYEVDQRRLLDEIEMANTAGTKINTIQFVYEDPLVKYGMPRTLDLIAERSGGTSKFIDARELGLSTVQAQ